MEKTLIFRSVDEIRLKKLLRFIIPTYLTSLFTTVYTIVDGIFVSAYVGTNALAAINVVYPLVNILYGIALAFATGGSALAALHIGGKKNDEASRTFSVSMAAAIVIGALVSALILFRLPLILQMLGATSLLMEDCKAYIYWWLFGAPIVVGKEMFTYFIRVDGSPTAPYGNYRCRTCNLPRPSAFFRNGNGLLCNTSELPSFYIPRTVHKGSIS